MSSIRRPGGWRPSPVRSTSSTVFRFAPVRPVTYRSRDGPDHPCLSDASAWSAGARAAAGHPVPTAVPFYVISWAFDPEVQFLVSRGYAVLQPNFRGSTGYGRDFVERGYGQLGTGMIDDIDDGADWLVQQGIVDPARICIMGSSYGGYAATWAAMRSPQRYRCAISWAGPSDLPAMVRHDTRFSFAQRYARERRRQLQGDEQVSLNEVSPLRHPERLQVPLLIGHGQKRRRRAGAPFQRSDPRSHTATRERGIGHLSEFGT